MVLYSRNCKTRGVAKLGCSDHFSGSDKGGKLTPVEQIMDIERYFAAFPALEKTVPSCLRKATDTCVSRTEHCTEQCSPVQSAVQQGLGTLKIDQAHAVKQVSPSSAKPAANPTHNGSVNKSTPPPTTSSKKYRTSVKGNFYRKNDIQHQPRNFTKFPPHRKKKPKQVRALSCKPWKHIPDLVQYVHVDPIDQKVPDSETVGNNEDWLGLSSSDLETILSSDTCSNSQQHILTFTTDSSNIWSDKLIPENDWSILSASMQNVTDDEFVSKDNLGGRVQDCAKVNIDNSQAEMAKSWHDDYEEIEEQMSQLYFCEDLDEVPRSSRFLNDFRDNPLSYMIRNGCLQSQIKLEAADPELMSCKHCEESFEVVLESETTASKPMYRSNLLSHVDSRLNFDWTKYHPPPWSHFHEEPDSETASRPVSCDCEFCRSRIWKKTCRWCATPL